jgi:hypothetical protein
VGYQLAPKTASNGQVDAPTAAVEQAVQHTKVATSRVKTQAKTIALAGQQLDSVLQVTENVDPETLSPDSVVALLDTLSRTAQLYRFEVLRYQGLIDTLLLTHQAERDEMGRQADALREALRGAEDRARCSAFGIPCPTRWQAFAIGVGVAATILVLR